MQKEYSKLSDLLERFSISRSTFYRRFRDDQRLNSVEFKVGGRNRYIEPHATNAMKEIYMEWMEE